MTDKLSKINSLLSLNQCKLCELFEKSFENNGMKTVKEAELILKKVRKYLKEHERLSREQKIK